VSWWLNNYQKLLKIGYLFFKIPVNSVHVFMEEGVRPQHLALISLMIGNLTLSLSPLIKEEMMLILSLSHKESERLKPPLPGGKYQVARPAILFRFNYICP